MEGTEERFEVVLQEKKVGNCKKHMWIMADPDPNSELVGLTCVNCSSGISVSKDNIYKYLKG